MRRNLLARSILTTNIVDAVQLLIVLVQYAKKSTGVKLREAMISLLFLRPVVDAYRVSTNDTDDGITVDRLSELIVN